MISLLCSLSLVLLNIGCTQSTYSNYAYPAPATQVELETTNYYPYYKQPSYQNDDYAIEKFEQSEEPVPYLSTIYVCLRKCRLISGLASFSILLPFMLHIHDICSNSKIQLPLFLMGIPMWILMMIEMSFTLSGFMDMCDVRCKLEKDRILINFFKMIINMSNVGLQAARVYAVAMPDQQYEGLVDELCNWEGNTLFTNSKWTRLVFAPTLLLIVITIVEIWIGYLFPGFPSEHMRK